MGIITPEQKEQQQKEEDKKLRADIHKNLDVDTDSASIVESLYKRIPTNARLLLENLAGVDTPITAEDFTKDELVEMVFLAEKQKQYNKRNEEMIRLGLKDEDITKENFDYLSKRAKTYDNTRGKTSVNPYKKVGDETASEERLVDKGYLDSLVDSFTDPRYGVSTTLGKYTALDENGQISRIKDTYNFNKKQRNLPTDFIGAVKRIMISPELAGEYIANTLGTQDREVDIKLPRKMKEGGMAKRMAKQMELFEPVERGFEDGGLMDEGGTVDPVSGNDVPPGSTQEEVRDDIPAQLSEGEFVFPADVVRYFGLEKLMEMRQEAKMGLQRMEDMGQMGNSEEAIMPDNLPFNIDDLDMEDENEYNDKQEFAVGGLAAPLQNTAFTPLGQAQAPVQAASAAAPVQAASAQPIQPGTTQLPGTKFTPTAVQAVTPTFQETIGAGVPGVDFEMVDYINEAGQVIQLRRNKATGEMIDPIPEGYKLKTEQVESAVTTPTTVETAQVTGGDDDGAGDEGVTSGATIAFGGTKATGKRAGLVDNAFSGKFSIEMPGVGPLGAVGALRNYMMQAPSSLAYGLTGGKFGEQLSLKQGQRAVISDIKVPGSRPTPLGKDRTLALDLVLDADAYNSMMRGNVSDRKEMEKIAQFVDKYGANIVGSDEGRVHVNDALRSLVDRVEEEAKKGNVVESGRFRSAFEANRAAQTAAAAQARNEAAQAAREQAAERAAQQARDDAAKAARQAEFEARDYGYDPGDQGDGQGGDFGSGGDFSAPICLTEDMKVKLNGVVDFVTNVKVGDIVDSTIVTEVLHKHMREGYYVVNGELKITNDHPVLANGSWKRTEDLVLGDYINNVEVTSLKYVEQVTPTVYIGTADDRYDVYTEGEIYTVHGQYKNGLKQAA